MVTQPRWLRAFALIAATSVVSATLAFIPAVAEADTAPAAGTPATVSSDALPTAQVDGVVWSQVIVGNTVFAGGQFANAQPAGAAAGANLVPRGNLMAYDLTTGALITTFAPTLNAQVRGLAASPDGRTIYAVGDFTTVNGVSRSHVVALDASTGAVRTGFVAKTNAATYGVTATASAVYVGGTFTSADGVAQAKAAAFDPTTGSLRSWAPSITDNVVRALVVSPDGSKVVLGGSFTNINGNSSPGSGLGAVDATTGASVPWNVGKLIYNHGTKSAIFSLASDGTNVYGTGYVFGSLSDGNLEGTFNASWADGTINWIEDCHGDSYSVAPFGDAVYVASHAHYCGNLPNGYPQTDPWHFQRGLAYSKAVTGTLGADPYGYYNFAGQPAPTLLTWYPDLKAGTITGQNQAAWSVAAGNGYVVYGGEFPTVNGTRQAGLVRFATKATAPNTDGPRLAGNAWTANAVSLAAGTVRLSWPANWDRDNAELTYTVYRNGGKDPVYTTTASSHAWWDVPTLGFVDTGLTPGSTATYKVKATDPFGNSATGATTTVTVAAGSAGGAYASAVAADGASHYWRFGEAGGSTVYDWSGYDDLTASSGVTLGATGALTGDSNTAASFSGTSTGFASTQTPVQAPNTFSVEAWFKTTSTAGGKIVGFGNAKTGDSTSYDRHVYMDPSGRVLFGVYPGSSQTLQSATGFNDGQWHAVVATLSKDGMQLFLDGKRVAARSDVTSGQDYKGYWRVGGDSSWSGANDFAGTIDDVAIYPTALTTTTDRNHWIASGHGQTVAGPSDAYGSAVFADAPDTYWRLGEGAGATTVKDSSGNGVSANVTGGVTLGAAGAVAGTSNTAASFDGTSGLIVSTQPVSDPENYSLELWMKTSTTTGGTLMGFGDASSGLSSSYDRHIVMLDSGQLTFGTYTGTTNVITSPKSYNDGAWHQVVATQGADGLKLWVDGALVDSSPVTQAQAYTGFWRLGGDHTWGGSSSDFFAGTLDEVAVYGGVLTPAQIAAHRATGTGGTTNAPPTAAFGVTVVGLDIAADGTASTDSDGSIASYAWDFGDGQTGSGATPKHSYAKAGTYQVTLTVTDDKGAKASTTSTVTVAAVNQPPKAAFTSTTNGLLASFDASGSTDADGSVTRTAWDFGDGATGTGTTTTHTYAAAGTYTVTATVTDDAGATDQVTHSVTVKGADIPPTASFTSSVTGSTTALDASASSDADGTVAGYAWSFGDGATGTGRTTTHTYAASGTYTVRLTVTDDAGATTSKSLDVVIGAASSTVVASDAFGRSVTGGFGSADQGGAWTVSGTASAWSVGSGAGSVGAAAGSTRSAYLGGVSSDGVDLSATLSLAALPVGGNAYMGLVGRRVGTTDYNARVLVTPAGAVKVEVLRDGTALKSTTVAGLTYTAGTRLTLRLQVTGTNPTTLQARVWATGTSEPTSWQAAATDTTAALQAAGSVGFRAYTGSAVTSGAAVVSVDDYRASSTGTAAAPQPPANTPPTAAFTTTATGLGVAFDGTGSTDKDGTVASYGWDFGDGASATGSKTTHTYAAAGTYSAVLTVTDDGKATDKVTHQVTVTAPAAAHLALDAFSRTVTAGLGSADTGGAWTVAGTASDFGVASGEAGVSTAKGLTRSAYLGSVSATDTDVSTAVHVVALPVGGSLYAGVVGRRVGTDDYNARLIVAADGSARLQLLHAGTALTTVTVTGMHLAADSVVRLRMQTVGSGTTTLRARAWVDGSAEPTSWQATATDTTAAMQAAGSVGIRVYVSSSITNSPLAVRFDAFQADAA